MPADPVADARARRWLHGESDRVGDSLPQDLFDDPLIPELLVPEGWTLGPTGIVRDKTGARVLPRPVLATGRLIDRSTGDESIVLRWIGGKRGKQLMTMTAPRDVVASSTKIVGLALKGLPVTSNTASDVVRWIDDFLAVNAEILPVTTVSSGLGWHAGFGFLLPDRLLAIPGAGSLIFHASDAGSAALAKAVNTRGALEGWKAALALAAEHERVRFAVAASFAAALLDPLDCPGFVLDFCGPTSGGKTSTLRLAASVWGQSNPLLPSSLVSTFQSTRVYRERMASLFNSLPVCVDDTMQARSPADVESFLYDVVSGQGRGRGSPTGVQASANWRTVAIISGESAAVEMTGAGGTKARTLTVYGRPFGNGSEAAGVIAGALDGVADHFGLAGPAFAALLIDHNTEWSSWRQWGRERAVATAERAGGGPVIGRVATFIAHVEMASVLAEEADLLPWKHQDISPALLRELAGEARAADVGASALIDVLSWAASHADGFYNVNEPGGYAPSSGWLGRWDRGVGRTRSESSGAVGDWAEIGFEPSALRRALESVGQKNFDGMVRLWAERSWLVTGEGASRQKQYRLGDGQTRAWCYAITRSAETEALAALDGGKCAEPGDGD